MAARHMLVKNLTSHDLMPMLQEWLSEKGYEINTVANRIDAVMSGATLKMIFEDYGKNCTVIMSGMSDHIQMVVSYLSEISKLGYTTAPCEYCGVVFSTEVEKCPNCGAYRKMRRTDKI
jgi:rubrerythrin